MKRIPVIYPLLLVFVGGSALLAFSRINKVNFYHHYYRVIEEVQTRNSQEWEAKSPTLQVFSSLDLSQEHFTGLFSTHVWVQKARSSRYTLVLSLLPQASRFTLVWYLNACPAQAP
ncbi:MAG: hypothetical protein AAF694_23010 [Bacteroidota bacterium]